MTRLVALVDRLGRWLSDLLRPATPDQPAPVVAEEPTTPAPAAPVLPAPRPRLEGRFKCWRKRGFILERDAVQAAQQMRAEGLRAYCCDECGLYHVGTDRVGASKRGVRS